MDAPKCPVCMANGMLNQTYKVTGKKSYKCSYCKIIHDHSVFEDVDFKWKKDKTAWESKHKKKFEEAKDVKTFK